MVAGSGYQSVQPGLKAYKSTLVPLGGGPGAVGPQQRRAAAGTSSHALEKPKAESGEGIEKEYIYNSCTRVWGQGRARGMPSSSAPSS